MRKIMLFFLVLFLTSCATSSKLNPPPVFEITKGSRVGVVNFVGFKMKHYHVGSTVFNNFEKEISVDWNIPGFINQEVKRQATELGYEVVFIESDESTKSMLNNRILVDGDRVVLNPEVTPLLSQFTNDFDIDMLFIFEPATGSVNLHRVVNLPGYGVGTRSFLGLGFAKAYAMINANAIYLKPQSVTRGAAIRRSKEVPDFKIVGNFREFGDDDLSKIESVVKGYAKDLVSDLMIQSNLGQVVQ